jgi:hypothetical protein
MAKKAKVYTGTEWVDLAAATTDLSQYPNMTTTPISGFRNAIINGDFRIWQRGTSFSVPNQVVTYHADRFFTWNAGNGTVTVSRQDFTPGNTISGYEPQHYLRTAVTSVGTSTEFNIGQRIEDVRTFAGQTITISVWMKSDANRTVGVKEFQNFGTGGSTFASMSLGNFNVTTSWQRFSVTTTVPSISGKTIGTGSNFTIEFSLPASNQTTEMWGMQVEKGTIATPFEQRFIGTELSLCQRYYEVGVTPAQFVAMPSASFVPSTYRSVYYKTNKRISNPVVAVTCTNHDNASGNGTVLGTSDSAFVHYLLVANTSFPYNTAQLNWTSNAEL